MHDREQLAVLVAGLVLLALGARLLPRSAWALLLCGLGALLLGVAAYERARTRERRQLLSPPPPGADALPGADVIARVCGELRRPPGEAPLLVLLAGSDATTRTTIGHAVAWQLRAGFADGVAYVNGCGDSDRPWPRAALGALLASYLGPSAALPDLSDDAATAALRERLRARRVLAVLDNVDGIGIDYIRWLSEQLAPGSALLVLSATAAGWEPLVQSASTLLVNLPDPPPPNTGYDSLDEDEQRQLRALCVFDDAFTRAHLAAVCSGSPRRIEKKLTRAGLLLVDPRPDHYRLPAAVRAAGLASLPADERDAVMQRLVRHVLDELVRARSALDTGDEVTRDQAHRAIRRQWPHLLSGQAWAAARAAELPAAARLCIELGRATSELDLAYFADATATTRRFREDAVRAARVLAEPAILLQTLLAAGRCCLAQRELQRAADCFEEYRQLAATGAPAPQLQDALAGLAALYASRAEYDRALERAEHRLQLARAQSSDRNAPRIVEAVEQLGSLLCLAGQTERAVEVLRERLTLSSGPLERFSALLPLAEATLRLGDSEAAIKHLDEAVATARQAALQDELGTALFCLGRAHMHLGEPRRARALLLDARAASKAAGQPVSAYDEREAELVGRLGDLALELGDQDGAMTLYAEQLQLAEADPRADVGLALANLALWHALRGDLPAADSHLRRFQEVRSDQMRLDSVRRIGHLFLQLGNGGRALNMFREVLAHVRKGRHALEEAAALLDVGATLRRGGEARHALVHLRAALSRARSRKERRVEALASWELGLIHAQSHEIGAAVSALKVGIDYLDAIEYPREAKDYQRNLALLNQLRQQLN